MSNLHRATDDEQIAANLSGSPNIKYATNNDSPNGQHLSLVIIDDPCYDLTPQYEEETNTYASDEDDDDVWTEEDEELWHS